MGCMLSGLLGTGGYTVRSTQECDLVVLLTLDDVAVDRHADPSDKAEM